MRHTFSILNGMATRNIQIYLCNSIVSFIDLKYLFPLNLKTSNMKNFKQARLLFSIVLLTGIISCTKDFKNHEHVPDYYKGYFKKCLITHLVDSFNYLSLDIFYNSRKQIDSVKLNS